MLKKILPLTLLALLAVALFTACKSTPDLHDVLEEYAFTYFAGESVEITVVRNSLVYTQPINDMGYDELSEILDNMTGDMVMRVENLRNATGIAHATIFWRFVDYEDNLIIEREYS